MPRCPKCHHIFDNKRSANQNNYYWGVILPHFSALHDGSYSANEWHDILREMFLFYCKTVNGWEKKFLISTTALDKGEAEEYYQKCRNFYSDQTDHKYFIPLPNEG